MSAVGRCQHVCVHCRNRFGLVEEAKLDAERVAHGATAVELHAAMTREIESRLRAEQAEAALALHLGTVRA